MLGMSTKDLGERLEKLSGTGQWSDMTADLFKNDPEVLTSADHTTLNSSCNEHLKLNTPDLISLDDKQNSISYIPTRSTWETHCVARVLAVAITMPSSYLQKQQQGKSSKSSSTTAQKTHIFECLFLDISPLLQPITQMKPTAASEEHSLLSMLVSPCFRLPPKNLMSSRFSSQSNPKLFVHSQNIYLNIATNLPSEFPTDLLRSLRHSSELLVRPTPIRIPIPQHLYQHNERPRSRAPRRPWYHPA